MSRPVTIAEAARVVDRNAAIIEELRDLHYRKLYSTESYCEHCSAGRDYEVEWPCDTMRIIDAVRL